VAPSLSSFLILSLSTLFFFLDLPPHLFPRLGGNLFAYPPFFHCLSGHSRRHHSVVGRGRLALRGVLALFRGFFLFLPPSADPDGVPSPVLDGLFCTKFFESLPPPGSFFFVPCSDGRPAQHLSELTATVPLFHDSNRMRIPPVMTPPSFCFFGPTENFLLGCPCLVPPLNAQESV